MINFALIALLMLQQSGNAPQVKKQVKPKSESRIIKTMPSRHKSARFFWRTSQATAYSVAENGSRTANGEHNFSNGPEFLCAMPTNLNPSRKFCRHTKNQCSPIYVRGRNGEIVIVHVIDHCPHSNVIDFNQAAANKIFLGKNSSQKIWWSRSKVQWVRV
jgi:hypothetical protein